VQIFHIHQHNALGGGWTRLLHDDLPGNMINREGCR
jgi:hypothetical protein